MRAETDCTVGGLPQHLTPPSQGVRMNLVKWALTTKGSGIQTRQSNLIRLAVRHRHSSSVQLVSTPHSTLRCDTLRFLGCLCDNCGACCSYVQQAPGRGSELSYRGAMGATHDSHDVTRPSLPTAGASPLSSICSQARPRRSRRRPRVSMRTHALPVSSTPLACFRAGRDATWQTGAYRMQPS